MYIFGKKKKHCKCLNGRKHPKLWTAVWRLWCPVCPWDTAQHQLSQPLLPWARPHYLSLALKDEELTDLLLLVDIILLQQFFVQPVRVLDTWYWVLHLHEGDIDHLSEAVSLGQAQVSAAFRSHWACCTSSQAHLLQSRGDRDDLLDGAAQPLDVVVPVQNLSVQEASDNRAYERKAAAAACFACLI